jgi:hypothetical protein
MDPWSGTRVAEVAERLRRALVGVGPAGWARISLDVKATAEVYELAASVLRTDGTFAAAEPMGREATSDLQELRELMYRDGRGTWFSARLVVYRDAEPEFSVNFDEDPQWSPELHPTTFVRDLELFPRSEDHIAPWLRARLAEGALLEADEQQPGGAGTVGERR